MVDPYGFEGYLKMKVKREDPNRDGERGLDYLTSALVLSKAHHEGCRASHGEFPYWCRAYGGEPTVNLLCSFLNLGRAGDWLTISNRGLKNLWKHSLKEPVIYYRGQEMDFRSFMMQEIDGEFKFLPEGCID
ncbi:hypothetical protein Tco_1221974, partial [Tanacetum coccineum]